MGRRAHKADPAQRRPVEAMAAYGVPETDIARWWVRSENAAQALPRRTRPGRDQGERRPIVIMPHKCTTVEEWPEQYASQRAGASAGR